MNCLDYRRQLLAGEGETDAMRVHRLQCAGCAAEWREHGTFEEALRDGFAVAVPQGFAESMARSQAARRRKFLAAAASVAVAAGAGGHLWLARQDPLALACIDFVMKEEAKSIMMGPMPRDAASRVLAATLPLERIEGIGQVRHVGPCPFNGRNAYHLVLAVPQGKVTLLVMPGYPMQRSRRASKEGLSSVVVAAGDGSVGVIGTDADVVESVAGALRG
jgi:hypothetical protein